MSRQDQQRLDEKRAIAEAVAGVVSASSLGDVLRPTDAVWGAFDSAGFAGVGTAEDHGGSGGSLSDLVVVVRALGASGISLAATELRHLSSLLMGVAALPGDVPVVPRMGAALPVLDENKGTVTGAVRDVTAAREATRLLVVAHSPSGPCAVGVDPVEVIRDINLAGEPRDTVRLDAAPVVAGPVPIDLDKVRSRQALLRGAAVIGTLERIRDLTLSHARDRVQFGKPLAAFQAIQQLLAEIAEEVSAAGTLIDVAADDGRELSAAAAWVRVVEAGASVAQLAHQVHGAIGTSREYPLGYLTTRMWSWSAELGSVRAWKVLIGRSVLGDSPTPDLWHAMVPLSESLTSSGSS
jgi:acyl-CoA dehydrogenase